MNADGKRANAWADFTPPPVNGPGHERRARNLPSPDRFVSDPYVLRLIAEWDAWLAEREASR